MYTVENARSAGYEVDVVHQRVHATSFGTIELLNKHDSKLYSNYMYSKGGVTHVRIKHSDGYLYGTAVCSMNDNFNKAKGVDIAIGRALKGTKVKSNQVFEWVSPQEVF